RLLTKLKKEDLIFLNGKPTRGWVGVNPGDEVTIRLPEEKNDFPPEDIPLDIVFEDDDIIVINKQPYIVVHPTKGKPYHTIANAVSYKMLQDNESYKIRFVNRLDMNTSGLLIIAKNSHAQNSLSKQMQTDELTKKYIALTDGIFEEKTGTISAPLGRPDPDEVERWVMEDGLPSVTHYRVLKEFKKDERTFSLVEFNLETGRTHQIRVHSAYIGHPIVGDHLYLHGDPFEYRRIHGDPRPPLTGIKGPRLESNPEIVSDLIDRQALHAYYLEFTHPVTGEHLKIETEIPEDMKNAVNKLEPVV
ncbi:MAG: RluA family pseudouridine synthase, partial [Clostridia bacterium]|nr:RluA family pseudouridine synthase [Clostridia bacterium]